MTPLGPRPRPGRPGIFRRRMILQLTSLLDLMLIVVFVQYLEMQQSAASAVGREADRRREAEAGQLAAIEQRDVLIRDRNRNLNEVWDVHVNGAGSIYPDGSVLISFAGEKKVILPRDPGDFVEQFYDAVRAAPRPENPCLLVETIGDVTTASRDLARQGLARAAADGRLQRAWGGEAVQFIVVDGGFSADPR
jgi:hypothetical protein